MNQETVNAMYEKMDSLRDAFETFLEEHDTPEAEETMQTILDLLSKCINTLSDE